MERHLGPGQHPAARTVRCDHRGRRVGRYGGHCSRTLLGRYFTEVASYQTLAQSIALKTRQLICILAGGIGLSYLFSVDDVELHHFPESVQHLDAQFLLLVLQKPFRVFDQPPDESATVTFLPRFRSGRKEMLRSIEDVHDDGIFRLDQRKQLGFQQDDDVLQSFDDAAIHSEVQLTLRRLAAQLLLLSGTSEQFAVFGTDHRFGVQRSHRVVQVRRNGDAPLPGCGSS